MRLKNNIAVVTGAGSGIGAAIGRRLASEGAGVLLVDLSEDAVAETADAIERDGGKAYTACADVTDSAAITDLIVSFAGNHGRLDVLVNNAGNLTISDRVKQNFNDNAEQFNVTGKLAYSLEATKTMTDEDWDDVIRCHLYGSFYCTRAALQVMEEQASGSIVNMSSVSSLEGLAPAPHYAAAKGGINAFTKSVAREVVACNIRCNAVAPGYVETPLVNKNMTAAMQLMAVMSTPMGRMGRPEEVASCVAFLASQEASYITGQVISPNGGMWQ